MTVSIKNSTIMVGFTIISAFTISGHFLEIVVTVYLEVSQQGEVNAWLLGPQMYYYSTWLLVGEEFVQTSRTVCS